VHQLFGYVIAQYFCASAVNTNLAGLLLRSGVRLLEAFPQCVVVLGSEMLAPVTSDPATAQCALVQATQLIGACSRNKVEMGM